MTEPDSIEALVEDALAGDIRTLSRLATFIENESPVAERIASLVAARAGSARTIGFTGPPGSGKSTLIAAVTAELRERSQRVAILAVDPSSPITGGATLGDRIRMGALAGDDGVFIRSLAARTAREGVAPSLDSMIDLFDAAGYGTILVESVGSGQQQVRIADYCETVILVLSPGAGDSVQMMKAGILEIADIFVVNKADAPGARELARELRSAIRIGRSDQNGWIPPVVTCSAIQNEQIDEVVAAIEDHQQYAAAGRSRGFRGRMEQRLVRTLIAEAQDLIGSQLDESITQLATEVEIGERSLASAVDVLSETLGEMLIERGQSRAERR